MPRSDTATVDIKIRMREPLRAKIERSAEARGTSMNSEMVARLEQSYSNDQSLISALDFAYGEETAAVLLSIAKVIEQSELECEWIKRLAGDNTRGMYWSSDAYCFEQTERAVMRVLEALRPPGDGAGPAKSEEGQDLAPLASKAGDRAAANVLDALIDPPNAVRRLGTWAQPLTNKLGSELIARIAAAERLSGKTVEDQMAKEGGNTE